MERIVIVIVGPTASGKTETGLKLAEKLQSEIISADSRQIFKFLSIGTAKPTREELKKIKHHFVDFLNPDEYFNAAMFEREALKIIEQLFNQGKTPIVVGGSGLYIRALIDGIIDKGELNIPLRNQLLRERKEFGNEFIYNKLKALDPKAAATMLPQNWKRVIRAIEVFEETGKSIIEIQKEYSRKVDFDFRQFGLLWKREKLYERIEKRVDSMIENNLVSEVKDVLKRGFSPQLNSLNTVGYKEIIAYLNGEYPLERAVELIKRNTRRFAKRQITWFKRDERIDWIQMEENTILEDVVDYILAKAKLK